MARGRSKVKRSPAKQAKVNARRRRARVEVLRRLQQATLEYLQACRRVPDCPVVCERCGLLQEYKIADHTWDAPSSIGMFEAMTKITPCPGPLELGCGGLYCITAEHYEEEQ